MQQQLGLIWEMRGLFIPVPGTWSGNGEGGTEAHPGNDEEVGHRSKTAAADTGNDNLGVISEISVLSRTVPSMRLEKRGPYPGKD